MARAPDGVALIIAVFYAARYVHAAYKVTERNSQVPLYEASGQRLQREMPENACFFLDDERVGAHFDFDVLRRQVNVSDLQ